MLRLLRNPLPHTHPHLFHIRRFPIDLGLVDYSHFGDDHHGGPGGVPLFEERAERYPLVGFVAVRMDSTRRGVIY